MGWQLDENHNCTLALLHVARSTQKKALAEWASRADDLSFSRETLQRLDKGYRRPNGPIEIDNLILFLYVRIFNSGHLPRDQAISDSPCELMQRALCRRGTPTSFVCNSGGGFPRMTYLRRR